MSLLTCLLWWNPPASLCSLLFPNHSPCGSGLWVPSFSILNPAPPKHAVVLCRSKFSRIVLPRSSQAVKMALDPQSQWHPWQKQHFEKSSLQQVGVCETCQIPFTMKWKHCHRDSTSNDPCPNAAGRNPGAWTQVCCVENVVWYCRWPCLFAPLMQKCALWQC